MLDNSFQTKWISIQLFEPLSSHNKKYHGMCYVYFGSIYVTGCQCFIYTNIKTIRVIWDIYNRCIYKHLENISLTHARPHFGSLQSISSARWYCHTALNRMMEERLIRCWKPFKSGTEKELRSISLKSLCGYEWYSWSSLS